MFLILTKPYKIVPFLNGKTGQLSTKLNTALNACSMLVTFPQEVICASYLNKIYYKYYLIL